ncbi:MAG: phosphate signaling complex protein PhoU [Acidobacteriota bacterium]
MELLLRMAAAVERNIGRAVEGLRERDAAVLEEVVEADREVDLAELRIDELCIAHLALRAPIGRDLRWVVSTLKIVKDVERVGDIAKSIARHGLEMFRDRPVAFRPEIADMARRAQALLRSSLDAFVARDAGAARRALAEDDELDRLYRETLDRLTLRMREDPAGVPGLAHYLSICKFLERVGDHSCNIAAMVVFLVEGVDIRHRRKQPGAENPIGDVRRVSD